MSVCVRVFEQTFVQYVRVCGGITVRGGSNPGGPVLYLMCESAHVGDSDYNHQNFLIWLYLLTFFVIMISWQHELYR